MIMSAGWVGPAITAIDNLFSRFESHWQNNKQREFSADQANEQRVWESEEAQKARDWQSREWQRQFDAQNAYNSPSAAKARLLDAGVNPWLSQSSIGSGNSTPNSTPPAGVPSGASASSPSLSSPLTHDVGAGFTQMRGVGAQIANQQAQAFKTSVEAAQMLWKISPDLAKNFLYQSARQYGQDQNAFSKFEREFELDMTIKKAESDKSSLEAALYHKYGDTKAFHETNNLIQAYNESVSRCGLMASQGKLNDSQIELNDKKVYEIAATIVEKYANAFKLNAEANTINSLRGLLYTQLEIENKRNGLKYEGELNEWHGKRPMIEINESINDPSNPNYWIFKFVYAFDKLVGERIGTSLGLSKAYTNLKIQ